MIPLREEIFIRPNGHRVAFSEYGDGEGEPVIFCHGWPSSRLMAQFTHNAARDLRVRIISSDRPGIADSGFVTGRKLLDWAPLVSELADFLRLEKFRVLGISGGAPYAYAVAWAMPNRVRAIAVVSGALGKRRPKVYWPMRGYLRNHGDFRWVNCACPFGYGMATRIEAFPLEWPGKWPKKFRTVICV